MKAGLLTIAALAVAVSAQPHRRHQHHRRDEAVEYKYETEGVTVNAPVTVVYVDENGNPITANVDANVNVDTQPAAAPVEAPAAAAPAESKPSEAPPAAAAAPPSYAAPPAAPGHGIAYSPYNSDHSCKSQDQVNADFTKINDYSLVRIYGTDCDQVTTVKNAAAAKGMKMFLGIFDINAVQAECDKIISAMNGDWSIVDTVSVGNEIVNAGGDVGAVTGAVNQARSILRAAGYQGPVVTVDTFVAMISHPELCQCSDYAAANAHAFFDGGVTADQAGQFVLDQSKRVADACGGKKVVITESGWPWQGGDNGKAIASAEAQSAAIGSLKSSFPTNMILFTAFDDLWKANFEGSHGAECHWGFVEHS